MTWLTVQEAALMCGVTDSAIKKAVQCNRYESCYVEGRGRGGRQIRVSLESFPDKAQARYHGEQDEKSADILLSLTDAQRDVTFSKLSAVEAYQDFKRTYPKADKLQAFQQQMNRHYQPDALMDFLELVNNRLEFRCWLFGHYHDNRTIDDKRILLWGDIIQLT